MNVVSLHLVTFPHLPTVFDCLQYAKTDWEGLEAFIMLNYVYLGR